ncbi:HAMP domain-containing protein [Azotobacter beijerinckii]|uniref:histidine kinase n=2 Tax=Azotobacter beijerinckii TaxID=170623 RepID=A0A1H9GKV1_9GAMM|nr:HAMP domain-containing protein [Azotobacter beijerinckii]
MLRMHKGFCQPGTRLGYPTRLHLGSSHRMNIAPTNRLSYKQASLAVLAAFLLGTLLSLAKIGVDYASQSASIEREINSLQQISLNPAARIAYNIDAELAQELLLGLLRSPAVIGAEIIGSDHRPLASVSRPAMSSEYRVFSDMLFKPRRYFEAPLSIAHAPDEPLGFLRLEIDTYAFGSAFLERSGLTLLTGFASSLLLAMVLLVVFNRMLTRPLVGIIHQLSEHNPNESRQLLCPTGHENDEIGILAQTINQLLRKTGQEIDQRREAENRLTEYLGELENMVSSRTAELEAANARLTQSNRDLETARSMALEMAQARSAFLANMSHEIRTPLNGLLGMLSLSLDGPLSSEQRQQLSVAHASGKVLVRLLNDVLDLSKFESGQMELEQIPFDLGALIEDATTLLSQSAAPGVELTCLIDPELPAQVIGDPTRVRQIASNLISNALKFTRFGRVDVRLQARDGCMRLAVRDTGIGISREAQARIFQPFAQATADITRQYGGTGLGLALTRKLCEAMQGRLAFSSKEGLGSTFTVELPLPSHTPATPRAALQGRVVALTPGSSGLADLLEMQLPHWGLEYRRADIGCGLAGIEADLLITDCPQCLLGLRPAIGFPFLVVTAYGSFLPREETLALAPLQQLARPLSRSALYLAVTRALQAVEEPPPSEVPDSRAAPRQQQVLLVEDNPVNQMVAKGMLVKLGYEVAIAPHGAEALSYLEHGPVDLILMDCNMPVMDGYETSRRIRQDGRWPELPIIALTANVLPEERERCRSAGMSDYLAKPLRREDLANMLHTWLPSGTSAT